VDLPESPIHNISDTARWVAVYRSRESERPDAVFRDPFAQPLAGERGQQIAASMPFAEKNSWPFVARTWLIDQLISEQVGCGIDRVVTVATCAGPGQPSASRPRRGRRNVVARRL